MTDVLHAIATITGALAQVPDQELTAQQRDVVQVYQDLLEDAHAHIRRTNPDQPASSRVSDGANAAQEAASQGDWRRVLEHTYSSITSLPGDTGWTPKNPVPRPTPR